MTKTLKELCEREPQLATSIRERLLTIGHELVGEYVIDSQTEKQINEITGGEQTVSEYIRDMLYNAPIMPNGSFKEFLKSIASSNSERNSKGNTNGNGNYHLRILEEQPEAIMREQELQEAAC